MRICVLVPANTDAFNARILEAIKPVVAPDVEVSVRNITAGNNCIQNRLNWLENGFPVVQLAAELEREGFDGIWLSDFDMCGVEAAREVIDIPIVGGFPTSAFSSLLLAQKFSIITVLESTLAMQQQHVFTYGQTENFASIRAIDCPVHDLDNTQIVITKTFAQALKAIREDGAQAILLGCTGFVGVAAAVSELLTEELGCYVPVIDPNQAGFSMLVALVRMRVRPSRLVYSKASLSN